MIVAAWICARERFRKRRLGPELNIGFKLGPCGKSGEIDSERGVRGRVWRWGNLGLWSRGEVLVAMLCLMSGVSGVRRLSSS